MAAVMPRSLHLPIRRTNNEFMAPSGADTSSFQANKETEWSRVCDNVFDKYIADDDVFGLTAWQQHERSSSDDSAGGAFGYSMSSGQSNQTTGTSPDPTWLEHVAVTANMLDNPLGIPQSFMESECAIIDTPATSPNRHAINTQTPASIALNKPQSFWDKAVKTLERGAQVVSSRKERLKTSKSHPDFLSLGGFPSPATQSVPKVPTVPVEPLSIPRTRGRDPTSKKRSTSQVRSISRSRPQGVAKTAAPGAHNSRNVSPRKASLSPAKMMHPSRYRAAAMQEAALADHLAGSNGTMKTASHHQSLPPPPPPPPALHLQRQLAQRQQQRSSFPASPPSSTQLSQHDFAAAAFGGSPMHAPPFLAQHQHFDGELSPLTTTFQQARLHTPDASPFFAQQALSQQSYFDNNAALATNNYTTAVPLNDVFPERTTSLAQNRIGSFDFGFNAGSGEAWTTTGFEQPGMAALVSGPEVFAGVHHPTLQQLEHGGLSAGLGITCDGTIYTAPQEYVTDPIYQGLPQAMQSKACYPPMPHAMPTTPQKQMHNSSPSPPNTDSRARRTSGGSGLRRVSKHRRTKSTTSLPRSVAQAQHASDRGGFVNFTPDDSGKILSGVAPSGSSKTKARREKEAADKRRRLSQAAIKAVLEAGGDAEELVKAGFDV